MGFTGNPGEVKAYAKRLAHLAANSKYIAKGAAPKIAALVKKTANAGTDPYGAPHVPAKSGGKALAGAGGSGDISVRVERSGRAIKVVVDGILRFHHDGTRTKGRKFQKALRKKLKAEGYNRAGIKGAVGDFRKQRAEGSIGKVWDPKRPLIPNETRGIPPAWKAPVLEAAHELLDKVGATQTGGT